jgi:hypothetical protein
MRAAASSTARLGAASRAPARGVPLAPARAAAPPPVRPAARSGTRLAAADRAPARHPARGAPAAAVSSARGPAPDLSVDWRLGSLHILFVDETDTARARLAAGLFARVCDWHCSSNSLVALHCGLRPAPPGAGRPIEPGAAASLMSLGAGWGVPPKLFASPRLAFEEEDADRFQVIVALDDSALAGVLQALGAARPEQPAAAYTPRIASLEDFIEYAPDERLLQPGGSGLLDTQLRAVVGLHLGALRRTLPAAAAAAVPAGLPALAAARPAYMRPRLGRPALVDGAEAWEDFIVKTAIAVAGLHEYLIDARPPPGEYDDEL